MKKQKQATLSPHFVLTPRCPKLRLHRRYDSGPIPPPPYSLALCESLIAIGWVGGRLVGFSRRTDMSPIGPFLCDLFVIPFRARPWEKRKTKCSIVLCLKVFLRLPYPPTSMQHTRTPPSLKRPSPQHLLIWAEHAPDSQLIDDRLPAVFSSQVPIPYWNITWEDRHDKESAGQENPFESRSARDRPCALHALPSARGIHDAAWYMPGSMYAGQ